MSRKRLPTEAPTLVVCSLIERSPEPLPVILSGACPSRRACPEPAEGTSTRSCASSRHGRRNSQSTALFAPLSTHSLEAYDLQRVALLRSPGNATAQLFHGLPHRPPAQTRRQMSERFASAMRSVLLGSLSLKHSPDERMNFRNVAWGRIPTRHADGARMPVYLFVETRLFPQRFFVRSENDQQCPIDPGENEDRRCKNPPPSVGIQNHTHWHHNKGQNHNRYSHIGPTPDVL